MVLSPQLAGCVANTFPPFHTARPRFPDFLVPRCGLVANFWPMKCGWEGRRALPDLAQKISSASVLNHLVLEHSCVALLYSSWKPHKAPSLKVGRATEGSRPLDSHIGRPPDQPFPTGDRDMKRVLCDPTENLCSSRQSYLNSSFIQKWQLRCSSAKSESQPLHPTSKSYRDSSG